MKNNPSLAPDIAGRKVKSENPDLIRRLCNVLDIARQTIEQLLPDGFSDPDNPSVNIRPEKIIGETAFLLLAAYNAGGNIEVKERIDHLAAILIPHARNEKMLLEICLQPALALEYAQAHICLTRIGYPDLKFDTVLDKSLSAQSHQGRERPPHRMLEQEWIKKIRNSKQDDRNSVNQLGTYSSLSKPIDLLHGTKDDMYAFTHALMYVTNFNLLPGRLPRKRSEIASEAEAMLARCIDEHDYDLAGELLLTWPLTRTSWSASAIFAFRLLARVEDEAGLLPSQSTNLETLEKLEGESRKKYLLATAYHTAFVMGLLCSATLKNGKGIPKLIPTKNRIPGSAENILHYLDDDAKQTHWLEEFNRLTKPEQDGISGFLLNILICRNIREKRYETVYGLLRTGFELGLADTPLASQTAELLERLALLSSF